MTTPNNPALDSSASKKPSMKVLLGAFLFLLIMGNPWTQELGHNIILDNAWRGGNTVMGFLTPVFMLIVMGFGGIVACFLLTTSVADWLEHRRSKKISDLSGIALFCVFLGLTVFTLIFRSFNVDTATTAVRKVLQAEKEQGFSPAIRPEVERMTRDYRTVVENEAVLSDLSSASARPKDIMPVLAAIDLLGADHPASRFVVENGLVRSGDVQALQVALLSRVRNGDPLARTALISLASSGMSGSR